MRIYPYGVARNRLSQAARRLGVPAVIVDEPGQADALVTLRSYYRKRQRVVVDAEHRNMPIYVLRANTVNQMQQFLSDLFNLSYAEGGERGADETYVEEAQMAVPLRLKVFKGEELVSTKEFERDMIKIGRLSTAHLCLDDEKASRK